MLVPKRGPAGLLFIPIFVLVVFAFTACGGESAGGGTATVSPPSVTPAATATAEPPPTGMPAGPGAGAIPLERFHYSATLSMSPSGGDGSRQLYVSTEGDFEWPDRHSFTYTTELGEGELRERVVIVGDAAWYARQEEPWRATTVEDETIARLLDTAFSSLRPRFLGGQEFERVRASVLNLPSTQEFINATRADHYRVDEAGLAFIEAFLAGGQQLTSVEDLAWDIWLEATDAWPVRLLMTGTLVEQVEILERLGLQPPAAWELRVDVSRPNDPDLAVETPAVE